MITIDYVGSDHPSSRLHKILHRGEHVLPPPSRTVRFSWSMYNSSMNGRGSLPGGDGRVMNGILVWTL